MTPAPRSAQYPGRFWAGARAHAMTAATRYGHPVIPLTRTKLPALPAAHTDANPCTGACGEPGHGIHDASNDPAQVAVLFRAAPWAAGYAIACGRPPHFLFGLDLDRKHGLDGVAELARLADLHAFTLPDTATVTTPSGGVHHWLTAPADLAAPNSASLLAPGVDTRWTGGYLVGPGSLGPQGRYAFAPGTTPARIAPAPPALLALLTSPQTPARTPPEAERRPRTAGSVRRRMDGLLRVVQDAGEGELNNRLYWAARTAAEHPDINPDTAAAALLAAAVAKGHPETPALRTIHSAFKGAARSRTEART